MATAPPPVLEPDAPELDDRPEADNQPDTSGVNPNIINQINSGPLPQRRQSFAAKQLGQFQRGRQLLKGEKPAGRPTGSQTPQPGQSVGEKVRQRAERKALQGLANAAKAVGRMAVRAVMWLVRTFPFWGPVAAVLVAVVLIIAAGYALYCLSGRCGGGPARQPSTPIDAEQVTLLSALTGNKVANDKLVESVVEDEKNRYQRIKGNADKYSPDLSAGIAAKITEINPELDALVSEQSNEKRLELSKAVQEKMYGFEATLPFGQWITQYAESFVEEPTAMFCIVTGVESARACASVVSTILWKAGVPNPIVPMTAQIWHNKGLQTIVDRPPQKSPQTWEQNQAKLKPGDIIWWGDGTCSSIRYGGKIFDHVGIYVGNGQAVDNSSSKERVLKRSAEKRSDCHLFNGAKRYGT